MLKRKVLFVNRRLRVNSSSTNSNSKWYLPYLVIILTSITNLALVGITASTQKKANIETERQEQFVNLYKNRLTYFDQHLQILVDIEYESNFCVEEDSIKSKYLMFHNASGYTSIENTSYRQIQDSLVIFYNDIIWLPKWVGEDLERSFKEYHFIISEVLQFFNNYRPYYDTSKSSLFSLKKDYLKTLYKESKINYNQIQNLVKRNLDF